MGRQLNPDRSSRSAWHIGADWVESAGPVLFDPLDHRLRQEALAERSRLDRLIDSGEDIHQPQVIVVDDDPVVVSGEGRIGRKLVQDGFSIFIVAEVRWRPDGGQDTMLRLARALPTANTATWSLVFSELGYTPDVVVADASLAIRNAANNVFGTATAQSPSLYHVAAAIRARLLRDGGPTARDTSAPTRVLAPVLDVHLRKIADGSPATTDPTEWGQWWDQLTELANHLRIRANLIEQLRSFHEHRLRDAIATWARYPHIPTSTGAVETIIARSVNPILDGRASGFGNLERTNRLLDLVVCRQHGVLDTPEQVAAALEADATEHAGFTTRLRQLDDPQPARGRYASLTDAYRIEEHARNIGAIT